jgi:hypothetical protein
VFYPSAQGDAQIKLNKTAFMKIQAFHTAFGEDNQVFSTEEIMDEVKLFSGAYKEEEDERLKYLHFLRKFRKDNREWFDKIKNLPLKSRSGRSSKKIKKPELLNGTAAFLKTDKKFEFYWVATASLPQEITPIEAFKIFEADKKEQSINLVSDHHEQVQAATNYFEEVEQKFVQSQSEPEALGGIAQRAKKFLSELVKLPMLTDKQKDNIKKIVALIDIGKYTKLPNEVAKLQKQLEKKTITLAKSIEALDEIAVQFNVEFSDTQKRKNKYVKPVLILSESFAE